MRNKLVVVPSKKMVIYPSPGFEKKCLSGFHAELCALCGFGCSYCSSNAGNYLRIHRGEFAAFTEAQLGERSYPSSDPKLMFLYPDIIQNLEADLAGKPKTWGEGETLVVSMLTDAFHPVLVGKGITEEALRLLIDRTSFRIRVLTKSAIVGNAKWVDFFSAHRDRFVVGLSTGTLDDDWAARIEINTSSPTARLRALGNLQAAGIATYGMLCPVFPDMLEGDGLERLLDAVNPRATEHVWAEPFNDRTNWAAVRSGYAPGSTGYAWLTQVYEDRDTKAWSRCATELYARIMTKAHRDGWASKVRFLLYEGLVAENDASVFAGLEGVLLQSKPDADGRSKNPHIARYQAVEKVPA